MSFFHIKNHSSIASYKGPAPWEFTPAQPLPSFESKEEFGKWCRLPSTDHYFFSLYEGLNANQRVSKSNPAAVMYGVVADYDSPLVQGDWEQLLSRGSADFPPACGSETFSGNARLVWLFERPIFVYSHKAHEAFLSRLEKELKVKRYLPALDEGAWEDTSKTYELGRNWRQLSDKRIPFSTLQAWLFKAGEKANWLGGGEVIVPTEIVAEEVEKQFPGRWQGEFSLGALGVRFWDAMADCPTGAIVREGGMQCFTGDKPFVTWREIFGQRFVEEYEEDRISRSIDNLFFDGRHYWRKVGDHWRIWTKEDVMLHFEVGCGLSTQTSRAEASEVKRALYHVQQHNRIDAALPLVHQPPGMIWREQERILNISNKKVIQPVDHKCEWGDGFPFIATYLDQFFDPTEPRQLDFFLAWLKLYYSSALEGSMRKGQAVFIVGPAGRGKTLLSTRVVGPLLGGFMETASILLGETNFNAQAYYEPLWTVDDSSPGQDPKVHAKFSANVKKLVANQSFEFHAKFRDAARIDWKGRIIVTLNDDPESLRMLPEAEISILDKVMFFKTASSKFEFPFNVDKVILAELPCFARWLLDWEVPVHCVGENRFGVKEYQHAELLDEARRAGRTGDFRELLEAFRLSYFEHNPTDQWEGTALQLLQHMQADQTLAELVRIQNLKPVTVGREMAKLSALGYSIKSRAVRGLTKWTISRVDEFSTGQAEAA